MTWLPVLPVYGIKSIYPEAQQILHVRISVSYQLSAFEPPWGYYPRLHLFHMGYLEGMSLLF
jgi:hypothetical protein